MAIPASLKRRACSIELTARFSKPTCEHVVSFALANSQTSYVGRERTRPHKDELSRGRSPSSARSGELSDVPC